jgi:hypothetical protein
LSSHIKSGRVEKLLAHPLRWTTVIQAAVLAAFGFLPATLAHSLVVVPISFLGGMQIGLFRSTRRCETGCGVGVRGGAVMLAASARAASDPMDQTTWCDCHVAVFEVFGGSRPGRCVTTSSPALTNPTSTTPDQPLLRPNDQPRRVPGRPRRGPTNRRINLGLHTAPLRVDAKDVLAGAGQRVSRAVQPWVGVVAGLTVSRWMPSCAAARPR